MGDNGPQVAEGGYTQTLKRSTDMDNTNDIQSEEQTGRLQQPAVMCCAVFEDMAKRFSWMSYEANGQRLACMPHIHGSNGERWRVNHCPSCGREVRSIEVPWELLA